ncbi:MAG: UvrD-helicase domain-containing protein [Eubacteriales bacterium]|nr:UvrD-helicase domain-containing protein [Eubacteriales bacterium]
MYIADLHIHSKYSRATSTEGDAPHLDLWARYKGIGLVGTGDFTHPVWRQELQEMLEPAEDGLYRLRDEFALPGEIAGQRLSPRFVLSGEISTIYKKDGQTRKVHHVILLPSLDAAEELSHRLEAIGNLHSDGRPILGLDSRDLAAITLDACPEAIFIPAHIWTPHFSLFGAFSCFSTLEECYGDMSPYIHALETGLSSDPPMNRRVSGLDGYTLVSNSDAHSPSKLGREANLLDCELSYPGLKHALETGEGFRGTIEFFPEEGKYHLDGHRNCDCCLEPEETRKLGGLCPVCGRKLTIGVLHRVEELADRTEPIPCAKPFESLIPLPELLGDCLGVSASSKKVQTAYFEMLKRFGSEFSILRELPVEIASKEVGFPFGEALRRLRAGEVHRVAGYDGEYGKITLFQPHELELLKGQTSLLELARPSTQTVRRPVVTPPKNDSAEKPIPQRQDTLNPEQQRAVQSKAAVIAVVAGPGTGKTKTLVERIAALIENEGVSPTEITAVTFTNRAAKEMKDRLQGRLNGREGLNRLTVGTFHAIAMALLPKKPIISREEARLVMEQLLMERGEKLSPSKALALISAWKNDQSSVGLPVGLGSAYQERVNAMGLRDLDDLLLETLAVEISGKAMFRYLLVDEYQDINAVQRRLVEHWSQHGKSLFVIGDPDQSIYGFRGADARCFAELLQRYPDGERITLKQNYRSAPSVVRCATAVIAHNEGGGRELCAKRAEGTKVRLALGEDPFSEGVFIAKEIARMTGGVDMLAARNERRDNGETRAFSEMAVLSRTHRQLEQIEYCLRHDDIPCVIAGREDFWEDGKVNGMLSFFRSLEEPSNTAATMEALRSLWKCPDALAQSAAETLRAQGPEIKPKKLRETLNEFQVLSPWLNAVDALLPALKKQKPRKLLEELMQQAEISGKAVDKLLEAAVFHRKMADFLQAILTGEEGDLRRRSGADVQSGAVQLMTLHAAKGLEFPVAFVAGVTKGELPLEREKAPTSVEEERRLFFVGVTRARDELVISCGGEPSVFVKELPKEVKTERVRSYRPAVKMEQLSLL